MSEQRVLVHLNLGGNELRNVALENLASHPANPAVGRVYFNSFFQRPFLYTGLSWQEIITWERLNDELNTLSQEITNVQDLISAADERLTGAIEAEVTRATAAEGSLASEIADVAADLTSETARATAAEEALAASVADVNLVLGAQITGLQGQLDSEIERATAAETALADYLSDETTRATAAEAGLASDIAAVAADVAALNGDYATDAELASAVSALNAAIATEVANRAAEDGALAEDISNEAFYRSAADTQLASDIAAEAATRESADSALAADIATLQNTANVTIPGQLSSIESTLDSHDSRITEIETTYATTADLDAVVSGLDVAESVAAALYSVAATSGLTHGAVTLTEGARVVVLTGEHAGLYVASSSSWAPAAEVADAGTFVFVEGGEYANTGWVRTAAGDWRQFSGAGTYTAGNGLELDGTQFAVIAQDGIISDGSGIRVDRNYVAFKESWTIGDGVTTSFQLIHGGPDTADVVVSVRDVATGEIVLASVTVTNTDEVTDEFATAPAQDAYRVTIIG